MEIMEINKFTLFHFWGVKLCELYSDKYHE